MRHLEAVLADEEPHSKEQFFDELIMSGSLMTKAEFRGSDDEDANKALEFNDSGDEYDVQLKGGTKRNRRKALVPQRAVQLEVSQCGSMGNSSESSDLPDSLELTLTDLNSHLDLKDEPGIENLLLSDNENALELHDSDDLLGDISEEGIFQDFQEEADAEKFDDEMLDNVKEEWRAHWGVKCNMCEQVFPYKAEFDKHYQDCYGQIPVYTCTFCNKTADKYSTFRSHCYRHITEGRYKCQECPKGFSLQSMLQVHVLAKHTKAKPFMCEECGKSFVTKPGLKIHIKKHKTETREDYPCVECGKILHTRGGLTAHMAVHRLGKRFMCDVCGKTFTQKVNMQQHVKQHTGEKPHECDKCGKAFAEKSHLARHYSFHSDQRPYKCDVCQKMYKTERCLKVHSLVHASERPFVCSYCSKGFLSSTKLKQHYNIHTGERPFKCKYCERTFTNYPNWLKHTRRRHKVDHKTGEELSVQKVPKKETLPVPPTVSAESVLSVDSEQVMAADIAFSRADDLILQQSLLNFPLVTDGVLPQQVDFFGGASGSTMGVIVPYFQAPLTNNQQTFIQNQSATIQMPFNEFVHTQYLQQPLL